MSLNSSGLWTLTGSAYSTWSLEGRRRDTTRARARGRARGRGRGPVLGFTELRIYLSALPSQTTTVPSSATTVHSSLCPSSCAATTFPVLSCTLPLHQLPKKKEESHGEGGHGASS